MPGWLSDLLSNATAAALSGVVVGAVLSYVVGAAVATRTRRDTHRAAVRAVLYELTENLPKVDEPNAPGVLTTAAFDGLVIPLYTDLPDKVAHYVSLAYAMLHVTGPRIRELPGPNQQQVRQTVHDAHSQLRAYAEKQLRLSFNPPADAG